MLRSLTIGAAAALAAFAAPASAAINFNFINLTGAEYDTAGVFITGDVVFDGTTDDGTGFDLVKFQLWDDSSLKYEVTFDGLIGITNTFHFEAFYPGLVGTSAPGVGLFLYDLPDSFESFEIDPYFPPHYADPSECEENCGPVGGAVPEPSTWLMLLSGFALLGGAMRSRKPTVVTTFA